MSNQPSQPSQPSISRNAKTLIEDLIKEASIVRDYGDSYPKPQENTCYISDFGGFAAIFASLNINILSVSYEPASHPRRLYTTDIPQSIASIDLAYQRNREKTSLYHGTTAQDEGAERLYLDASSPHITFLIEFKARVTASDYSTQLKWVKFPVTAPLEDFTETPEHIYGQIIDQVLQAREMLAMPSIWASLTRLERGE